MRGIHLFVLAVALAGIWLGLTRAQSDNADLPIQARAILRRHCLECHGEANDKKRGDLSVLDRIGIDRPDRPFVIAKNPDASQLLQLIKDGSMPPGDRTKLTPEEQKIVGDWILAN